MFGTLFVIPFFCKAALLQEMDTHVDVQINKINESHFTGICSCSSPPYGKSAEFLIDNKTVSSISLINKVCYMKRRPCETNECSCTSTQFNITFKMPDEITYFALTCQVRILQKKLKRHLKVFATKTFDGKDVISENTITEQISFANGDSTQLKTNSMTGSAKNTYIYISVGTLIPVTAILITVLILFWRCIKERKRSDRNTDTEPVVDEERKRSDRNTDTEPVVDEESNISDRRTENEPVLNGGDGVRTSSLLTNNESSTQEGLSVTPSLTNEPEDITKDLGDGVRTSSLLTNNESSTQEGLSVTPSLTSEPEDTTKGDGVGTSSLLTNNESSTQEELSVTPSLTSEPKDITKGHSYVPLDSNKIYYAMSTFKQEIETDDESTENDCLNKIGDISDNHITTGHSSVPLDSNKIYYAMSTFKQEIETDDESDCLIKIGDISDNHIITDEPLD